MEEKDNIDIKEQILNYFVHWRLFFVGGLISVLGAFIFLRYTTPTYKIVASIMIKDNNQSGISTELAAFEDLGIIGGGSANNPENEIEIIQSRKIIGRVIDSLNLSTSYFREGRIRKVELYGKNIPIIIDFLEKSELLKGRDTVVVVSIIDNNQYELKDAEDEVRTKHSFGQFVQSKLGTFKIVKNPNFLPQEDIEQNEVDVFFHLRDKLIDSYFEILDIAAIKKLSPVIKISLLTHVREKGQDLINELVKQYNIDGIKDEGLVSQKTVEFY